MHASRLVGYGSSLSCGYSLELAGSFHACLGIVSYRALYAPVITACLGIVSCVLCAIITRRSLVLVLVISRSQLSQSSSSLGSCESWLPWPRPPRDALHSFLVSIDPQVTGIWSICIEKRRREDFFAFKYYQTLWLTINDSSFFQFFWIHVSFHLERFRWVSREYSSVPTESATYFVAFFR